MNREIHFPIKIRAPMPVQDDPLCPPGWGDRATVPIIFYVSPKFINPVRQFFFFAAPIFKKLSCTKQTLDHIRSLHKITTIVLSSKWFYFSRFTVYPVRPRSVETIGCFKEVNDLFQLLQAFLSA